LRLGAKQPAGQVELATKQLGEPGEVPPDTSHCNLHLHNRANCWPVYFLPPFS